MDWPNWLIGVVFFMAGASVSLLVILAYRVLAFGIAARQPPPNENRAILLAGVRHLAAIAVAGLLAMGTGAAFMKLANIQPGSRLSLTYQIGFIVGFLFAVDRYRRQKDRRRY